jgi:hypothetical protein
MLWGLYANLGEFATTLSPYIADGLARLNSAQTTRVMHRTTHRENEFALNLNDINKGNFTQLAAYHGIVLV